MAKKVPQRIEADLSFDSFKRKLEEATRQRAREEWQKSEKRKEVFEGRLIKVFKDHKYMFKASQFHDIETLVHAVFTAAEDFYRGKEDE